MIKKVEKGGFVYTSERDRIFMFKKTVLKSGLSTVSVIKLPKGFNQDQRINDGYLSVQTQRRAGS
jgi:hypothetical protein